jgi:hypothetical protein
LRIAVIGLEALAGEAFAGVKCVGTLKQAAGLARRSISICRRIEVGIGAFAQSVRRRLQSAMSRKGHEILLHSQDFTQPVPDPKQTHTPTTASCP